MDRNSQHKRENTQTQINCDQKNDQKNQDPEEEDEEEDGETLTLDDSFIFGDQNRETKIDKS